MTIETFSFGSSCNSKDINPDKISNVFVKDTSNVEFKIKNIFERGKDALHIIADYDMTLTKYWVNGKRNFSSHAVMTNSDKVSKEFKERFDYLLKTYYPIEISKTIEYKEKFEKMVEWWEHAHQAYIELKITLDDIKEETKRFQMTYRNGFGKFIEISGHKDIPVLVFSAGLADVIEQLLISKNYLKPHMHVISNSMKFDIELPHHCIAFKEPLIHVMNKGEVALKGTPFHDQIATRTNALLLGDSLGDLQMGAGLPHDTLLTIGFLNYDTEELLPNYMDKFDIVLTNDAPMDFILSLLNRLG